MCLFIETICYENGKFHRIELHNGRLNRTRSHFLELHSNFQLELFLSVPAHLKDKKLKCKVVYGTGIVSIEYGLYTNKPVTSLQIVRDDEIDYSFKYEDRTKLNALFQLRGQCDDILIVKNGFITDTSFANIIFRKDNYWYSPLNPLLRGTRLEGYVSEGRITPTLLQTKDLPLFTEARIINALISIEDSSVIEIKDIRI